MKYQVKTVLVLSIYVMLMAALAGCATPAISPPVSSDTNTDLARPSWFASGWENIYSPQIHPGKTVDVAIAEIKKDLDTDDTWAHFQTWDPSKGYTLQRYGVDHEIISVHTENEESKESIDDNLSFSELPEYMIYVIQNNNHDHEYIICLHGLVEFYFKESEFEDVLQIADDLFLIRQHVIQQRESRLALFKEKAAQYRALAIKPAMSEEQRKFVVQANTLNRLKDYAGAIGLYLKAIDLDPVSYPGAYFNLALINAQIKHYNAAVSYMKQYLMLVPDAKDARSARDRIYEWKIIEKKQES